MNAPVSIANAARARVRLSAGEIKRSLKLVRRGRPGDAEPDEARRRDVVQARRRVPLSEAKMIARAAGAEAIWGATIDFVDAAFLERGMIASRAVCRIVTRGGQAVGTGFLISPRLLITNNHVIVTPDAAAGMVAEFDFERDVNGTPRAVTQFSFAAQECFVTDDRDDLDFTVLALGNAINGVKSLDAFGYLPLSSARNKHALGDWVSIVQHPDGRLKEAVVRENQLVSRPKSGTVLHYVADTEPGSSGSPVFNVMWNVVALHHWGGPHRELVDENDAEVPRTVNEGIRTSAIVLDLETRKSTLKPSTRALIEDALKLGLESGSPVPATVGGTGANKDKEAAHGGFAMTYLADGTAQWQIPLTVAVRVGPGLDELTVARADSPAVAPVASSSGQQPLISEARIVLDDDYDNRDGYNRDFLPDVRIALPKLTTQKQKRSAAKNKEPRPGDGPLVLRYEHFSAIMNGKRRLAFFTATNIDGAHPKDVDRQSGDIVDSTPVADDEDEAAEASEVWLQDRRIEDHEQTPSDFFSGQTAFDASGRPIANKRSNDHRNRMFQQGHLTRRQDPLWGPDEVVLRAHADTFHVTNRAPQVGFFNMGTRKRAEAVNGHAGGDLHWRALEDFVLNNARADQKRVTVFTGPVLDDDHDIPWSRGRRDMRGFKAPRQFWKVVLRVDDGALSATALVADQSALIDFVPELMDVSDEEAARVEFDKVKKFHVSVAELEKLTELDFGPTVRAADTFVRAAGGSERRQVKNLLDVSLSRPQRTRTGATAVAGANAARRRRRPAKRAR